MTDNYLKRPSELDTHYKSSSSRYDKMIYRVCGRNGLKLPAISLGLWQNFGDVNPYSDAREMVLGAFDLGITHFDLGNNYGKPPGSAEKTMGRIIKEDLYRYRDEIIISTKAGYDMWKGPYGENCSKKHIMASIDQSLKRFGLEYVDIFYSHKFDKSTPLEETMEALAQIVRQGKALYLGISSYGIEETKRAHSILKNMGVHSLILHQASYSMFNRWIESSLLNTLDELGMGCTAFAPLSQGLLTDKYIYGEIPEKSRAGNKETLFSYDLLNDNALSKIKALSDIAKERGQTLAELALAWALRDKRITSLIVGARSIDQIKENVSALNKIDFLPQELERIDNYAKDVEGVNLWPPNCQTSQI